MEKVASCAWFASITALFSTAFGGFDITLKCLLLLMGIDIVCGFVSAALFDKSQYSNNGLTSQAMMRGVAKKMCMLLCISLGVVINKVLDIDYVREAIIMYFIASEGLSILEHMINMNVPFPSIITNMLKIIMEKSDEK